MSFQKNPRRRAAYGALSAVVMSLSLAACGGGTETSAESTDGTARAASTHRPPATPPATPTATLVAQPQNTEGRLLASNCFQCHGTLGTGGFDNIRGSEAGEVLEFMTKPASRDIMAAHAQGYTPEQLKKIIAYLQQ